MVGRLLGDVVRPRVVRKVPVAGENLAKNGIEGLLDARRSDVPTAEVEFDDGHESLNGVIDLGYRQEHLRVAHEAVEE